MRVFLVILWQMFGFVLNVVVLVNLLKEELASLFMETNEDQAAFSQSLLSSSKSQL